VTSRDFNASLERNHMAASKNGTNGNGRDNAKDARAAGLRYVSDDGPGIRRRRNGKGWTYADAEGKTIGDAAERRRIEALAIPPAWTDVWICPNARGHIQASGRDARGRKQYRYHTSWRQVRDAAKFDRMISFGNALPTIRQSVEEHMRKRSLNRQKVLSTVVRLLETTCIRVGNAEYARDNGTFGLTTLRDRHVSFAGSEIRFRFKGKTGKTVETTIKDRRLARIVRECQDIPGYELFQYFDEDGERRSVRSEDVNDFLREISGEDFTAKDFRTWIGTLHAFTWLCARGPGESDTENRRIVIDAIDYVADQLRNTRAVSRSSYVHPHVVGAYERGVLCEIYCSSFDEEGGTEGLDPAENALLNMLKRIAEEE
jgi:DNA topoisomerase-1